MHNKLNRITKGDRSVLDYIEIPTDKWFNSSQNEELFWYNSGVFKAYLINGTNDIEFKKYHVLKVVTLNAIQAAISDEDDHYKITRTGKNNDPKEMELYLLGRNKRNLKQVTKEYGITLKI